MRLQMNFTFLIFDRGIDLKIEILAARGSDLAVESGISGPRMGPSNHVKEIFYWSVLRLPFYPLNVHSVTLHISLNMSDYGGGDEDRVADFGENEWVAQPCLSDSEPIVPC